MHTIKRTVNAATRLRADSPPVRVKRRPGAFVPKHVALRISHRHGRRSSVFSRQPITEKYGQLQVSEAEPVLNPLPTVLDADEASRLELGLTDFALSWHREA